MLLDVIESLCDLAVGIGDALHHQHAFVVAIRLGHAHAGGGQSVQRIDFGVLPGDFLFPPAVAAALAAHCTRITAAARLASFLVFGQLVEATLLGVLVDFGATNLDRKSTRLNSSH